MQSACASELRHACSPCNPCSDEKLEEQGTLATTIPTVVHADIRGRTRAQDLNLINRVNILELRAAVAYVHKLLTRRHVGTRRSGVGPGPYSCLNLLVYAYGLVTGRGKHELSPQRGSKGEKQHIKAFIINTVHHPPENGLYM